MSTTAIVSVEGDQVSLSAGYGLKVASGDLDLEHIQGPQNSVAEQIDAALQPLEADHRRTDIELSATNTHGERPPVNAKETWRTPPINRARLGSVFLALFNLGIHESAFGPLIPSLERYYNLDYTTVSLIFLAAFPGYLLAAATSDKLHNRMGRRGIAAFASTLRIAAYLALVLHPPWAVIVVALAVCGWGDGLLDASYNSWAGSLARPNELLGFAHAMFGLGATISPILASAMIDKYGLQWNQFYYILLGSAVFELASGTSSFWSEDGAEYRRKTISSHSSSGRTRAALKMRVPWTVAAFLLVYGGVEVSLGGWVVTFMTRVRHGTAFSSAIASTGFWLGITIGRLVLGFVTGWLGERWTIVSYLLFGVGLELVFWLVPDFIVSAVAVALVGFVLGPMYPAAFMVVSKFLPRQLHVAAMSFTSALGMGGAAALPFAVGAIANAVGVRALQPIVLGLLGLLLAVWLSLPRAPMLQHED